jgi:predicted anti-sigma-YlaC factor YlaD
MNCKLCQREIEAYHGGKLPRDMMTQVESHLASCIDCRRLYAADAVINRVIDLEKNQESNPFLASRIMTLIEAQEGVSAVNPVRERILRPVLFTLAVAATVFLGIIIGNIPDSGFREYQLPLELTLMDDASLESVDFLLNE